MKPFVANLLTVATAAGLFLGSLGLNAQQPDHPAITMLPGTPEGTCPPQTRKVCVTEPKQNTRTVYATKCEEYCLPRAISLLSLFGGRKCDCDDGHCDVKVRHKLVVKQVEACETKQCVLKEIPVAK